MPPNISPFQRRTSPVSSWTIGCWHRSPRMCNTVLWSRSDHSSLICTASEFWWSGPLLSRGSNVVKSHICNEQHLPEMTVFTTFAYGDCKSCLISFRCSTQGNNFNTRIARIDQKQHFPKLNHLENKVSGASVLSLILIILVDRSAIFNLKELLL